MNKNAPNRQKWIEAGYSFFAEIGPEALNVEKLSSIVGLSRSSFYYYFGDLHAFEEALLALHLENYKQFGELMKNFENFKQLFSAEIMAHSGALSFQRQLLINKSLSRYQECSLQARVYTEEKTFQLWTKLKNADSNSEEEWVLFKALRAFFFVQYGQPNQDPQNVLVQLNGYLANLMK